MRFRFTLAVWGDWHLRQLEAHGIPSLRTPGNLDAVDYHVSAHTRPADRERLAAALDGLDADVKTPLPDDVQGDQGTANNVVHACKTKDYAAAAAAGEAWALLSPDMVWGEGTLAHHRTAFKAGKTAIYRPLLRVDAEKAGTIRDFGRRSLARIALDHEHAVAKTFYRADGPLFSSHAELIIWRAPGGLLNKTITAEMQTCVAGQAPYMEFIAPAAADDEMLVVGDSDEAITLALAPPDKNFSHVVGHGPLNPAVVRAFANWYSSPATEKIARRSYRLHAGDIDPAEWAEVERRAGEFIDEVFR
jgi:hypothetical protein